MPTVAAVCDFLKRFAPLSLAAEWDNVGLLLGDDRARVRKVMTCLTVTPETAAEAVEAGARLIVSHHPIFFRPVQKLTAAHRDTRFLWELAKAGVAVYSPHTAFDNTAGGINDMLARRLGLQNVEPLRKRTGAGDCKIVVFVPAGDLDRVADALFRAGAGRIGDYTECSYRLHGQGTFFGGASTNPAVGQKGRRETVDEVRLETVCRRDQVPAAVRAMRAAHPYEEPAFDVYPLEPAPAAAGEGRVGTLPAPATLAELARLAKSQLAAKLVQTVGDPGGKVQKVAVACGAAGEFLRDASKAKADVFLTGELRFHDYLAAQAQGLALILPGHYATERPGVEELAALLQAQWPDVEVWASRREVDPAGVAE